MQVLKFGGSSVANAENINKVIAIVKRAAANDRTVVVSSAISGATDALLLIGETAKAGNEQYTELIDKLQERHLSIIAELVPAEESQAIRIPAMRCSTNLGKYAKVCSCLKSLQSSARTIL